MLCQRNPSFSVFFHLHKGYGYAEGARRRMNIANPFVEYVSRVVGHLHCIFGRYAIESVSLGKVRGKIRGRPRVGMMDNEYRESHHTTSRPSACASSV